KPKPEAWRAGQRAAGQPLLDLDLGARFLELFLDARGLVLADAFLDGLGRAVNQVLGFLEAKAGDFANCLDDVDLVAADVSENNGEFRLLFRRSRRGSRAARGRDHGGRSSRNAEGFFHFLDQVGRFKKRQALDFFQDRFDFRHDCDFSSQFSESKFRNRGGRGPLSPNPYELNLLALTASLTVTARLRGSALSADAIRWAGAFRRNMILLINSSFDGMLASCWISAMEITLPSTTPDLNWNAGTSLATLVRALARATGSALV